MTVHTRGPDPKDQVSRGYFANDCGRISRAAEGE